MKAPRAPKPVGGVPGRLAEARGGDVVATGLGREDQRQEAASDEGADHLRDDVAGEVRGRHAAGDHHGDRHGRIDVAARDRPDCIGHGGDREPEGEGDRQDAHRKGRRIAAERDGAAADEAKRGRAHEFRKVFLHRSPPRQFYSESLDPSSTKRRRESIGAHYSHR